MMAFNRSRVGFALTAIFCLLIATAIAEKPSHATENEAGGGIIPSRASSDVAADASVASDSESEIDSNEVGPQASIPVFVPTYEFQKIPPGASVPEGLYIRMNLQTGEKEARKLLPSEIKGVNRDKYSSPPSSETNVGSSKSIEIPENPSSSSSSTTTSTECTAGADDKTDRECKLRGEEEGGSTSGVGEATPLLGAPPPDPDAAKRQERREKVKRAMEFKKAKFWAKKYQEVFHPEDDAKLIKAILVDVKEWLQQGWNATELPRISQHLADLEDLSHQIDNAVDMTSMGGLDVIFELLSRDDAEPRYMGVQSLGLWVAGTAVQNNDKVKQAALQANLIHAALAHLRSNSSISTTTTTTTTTTTASSDPDPSSSSSLRSVAYLRKKALYFLSAVLDSNLDAQKVFWDIGGPATVVRAWAESLQGVSSSSSSSSAQHHPLGSEKENLGLVRKAVGLTHRTISGHKADPERFLHGLVRVWLGIPELCELLTTTTLRAALKDERLAEDALKLLTLLLDDGFAAQMEEPPSACAALLSFSSSSSPSSSLSSGGTKNPAESLIDTLVALDGAFGRDEDMHGNISESSPPSPLYHLLLLLLLLPVYGPFKLS